MKSHLVRLFAQVASLLCFAGLTAFADTGLMTYKAKIDTPVFSAASANSETIGQIDAGQEISTKATDPSEKFIPITVMVNGAKTRAFVLASSFSPVQTAPKTPEAAATTPSAATATQVASNPVAPSRITADERAVLDQGRVTDGQWVAGGLVGTFVGFGIGQAIEGDYAQKGWIFTIGDVAGMGMLMAGVFDSTADCSGADCQVSPWVWVGLGTLTVFRLWEAIDAWVYPAGHNTQYDAISARLHGQAYERKFYVFPIAMADSPIHPASYGMGVQFRF